MAATVQGQPSDRRPFVPLLSLYGAKLIGCDLKTYYTDSASYARGQAAVVENFHPDVLVAPFAFSGFGEAFGGEQRYFDDQPPNLARPAIRSFDEWGSIKFPDIDSHPCLLYFRQALQQIASEHGHDTIIAAVMPGPFDLPIMIMGLEGWIETVLTRPNEVPRVLEETGAFFLRWIAAALADGANAVVLPSPFLLPTVVTRALAENIVLPLLNDIFAQLPCQVILHSVGAPFLPLLDLLCELPNVAGAVLYEGEDLRRAREILGPDVVLFGGVDGGRLWRHTPESLKSTTRAILSAQRDDPRFVFATVGPDVAWQTSAEQIHAIQDTISESREI